MRTNNKWILSSAKSFIVKAKRFIAKAFIALKPYISSIEKQP